MPSPLFPTMNAVQRQARKAFADTDLGKLVGLAADVKSKGRVAGQAAKKLERQVSRMSKHRAYQQLAGRVTKYAKDDALKALLGELGPVGSIIGSLLRPGGEQKAIGRVDQEIQAATKLLESFGYDVSGPTTQPPSGAGGGGGRPPRTPTGGAGGEPEDDGKVEIDLGNGSKKRVSTNDPIVTGEMIDVRSSNVHSIGYGYNPAQPRKSHLKVRYLQSSYRGSGKGPGPLYYYYNVPAYLFEAFQRASSKGEWVWDRLRVRGTVSGHQFPYELKGITGDYVPRQARRVGDQEWFLGRTIGVRRGRETVGIQSPLPDMPVATRPGRAQAARPGRGS